MQENIQKQDCLSKIAMTHVYLRLQLGQVGHSDGGPSPVHLLFWPCKAKI